MEKQYGRPSGWTTEEEARLLVETGLDPNTADMSYDWVECRVINGNAAEDWLLSPFPPDDRQPYEQLPCWSLGALISLIPHSISTGEGFQNTYYLDSRKHGLPDGGVLYQLAYGNSFGLSGEWHAMVNTAERERLVEAVLDMLLWLMRNGLMPESDSRDGKGGV